MSDLGKITTGFNSHEVRIDANKNTQQTPQSTEEQQEVKENAPAEVRASHFIPGQSQIGADNFAHDMKVFLENPELVEASNTMYEVLYNNYIEKGYSEADAAGEAANIQAEFINELIK